MLRATEKKIVKVKCMPPRKWTREDRVYAARSAHMPVWKLV